MADGEETQPNEFPWMVNVNNMCGGSLISAEWVLTAAHCVHGNAAWNMVELGQHDLRTAARRMSISRVIIHKDYNRPMKHNNDIALLKLKDPVDLMNVPNVGRICLPASRAVTFARSMATVAGWGMTGVNSRTSRVLKKTDVKVISNTKCRQYGLGFSSVTSSMLCTVPRYWENYYKGACRGDSGYSTIPLLPA